MLLGLHNMYGFATWWFQAFYFYSENCGNAPILTCSIFSEILWGLPRNPRWKKQVANA